MVNVGIIGIGKMGTGIVSHLLDSHTDKFTLYIYNHKKKDRFSNFKEKGAIFVDHYYEIAEQCDYVLICLPSPIEIKEVILDQLFPHLRSETKIIDLSTSSISTVMELTSILKNIGVHYYDFPMLKSPAEAYRGELVLISSLKTYPNMTMEKLLKSISSEVVFLDEQFIATKVKLLNNYISLSFTLIIQDALRIATEKDICHEKLNEVMALGSNYIGSLPLMIKYIKNPNEEILAFSIKDSVKDLNNLLIDTKSKLSKEISRQYTQGKNKDPKNGLSNISELYNLLD